MRMAEGTSGSSPPPASTPGQFSMAQSPNAQSPRFLGSTAYNPLMPGDSATQHSLVRDRFTRTADQFSRFALTTRSAEAEHLAALVSPRGSELALDLACGPGTFTHAFAPRTRHLVAFDITPAMLHRARASISAASLCNVTFACADAVNLPLPSASLDLAVCGYSLHHISEPARVVADLARVLRPKGRVALVDLIVPAGASSEVHNRIERARDASHAATLSVPEFSALVEAVGLRLFALELTERLRQFDDWMLIAGHAAGSPDYLATHRLLEETIPSDAAGFRPLLVPAQPSAGGASPPVSAPGLEFIQTSLFVVAEKP